MIASGEPMPALDLQDSDGTPLDLDARAAGHSVLLYFMRTADCPVCLGHVRTLMGRADEFEASDVEVIVVVPDGVEAAATLRSAQRIPYPVTTGRTGSAHEAVGLNQKLFGRVQQSGSILVGPNGRVLHAHGATVPTGALDRPGLDAALAQLRSRRAA